MKINKLYFCLVLSLLAVTVLGSFSPAHAADPDKWTSLYAGINAGYGMGGATTSFMPMKLDSVSQKILPSTGDVSGDFRDLMPQQLHPGANGIIEGGQIGFNIQLKRFVIGAETDLQGSSMDGSKTVTPIVRVDGTPFTSTDAFLKATQHTSYFGTVRPRVGVVLFPKLLLYATGGAVYANVDYFAQTNYGAGHTNYAFTLKGKHKGGYTAGAGLEYKLRRRLSVKGEYLFYDLGTEHAIAGDPSMGSSWPFFVGYGIATKAHIVRAGLNFRIK